MNPRFNRSIRAVPAERLIEEQKRMRALPEPMPTTALRSVLRVPQQPYFRFDTNDYSFDPRCAGRAPVPSERSGRRRSCEVLAATGARVLDVELAVGHAAERFDEQGRLTDESVREQLDETLNVLVGAVQPGLTAAAVDWPESRLTS